MSLRPHMSVNTNRCLFVIHQKLHHQIFYLFFPPSTPKKPKAALQQPHTNYMRSKRFTSPPQKKPQLRCSSHIIKVSYGNSKNSLFPPSSSKTTKKKHTLFLSSSSKKQKNSGAAAFAHKSLVSTLVTPPS